MSSFGEISVSQLARLVGSPEAPLILDVRVDEDFSADPRIIPASKRLSHRDIGTQAALYAGKRVVVSCQKGLKLSEGVAAWLRHAGAEAMVLEGGHVGWRDAGAPLISTARLPARDASGTMVWVTRHRPKIDRIACPWLIRRFVDPEAMFLFVAPTQVEAVAERFSGTPFDIDGVFWSHRGETCTFDTMIAEFGLTDPALLHLARIVRAADTATLDAEPQAAGLLAASLGLSRMYRDDLKQLDAAMILYDALYRWCRDATGETHNWPNPGSKP